MKIEQTALETMSPRRALLQAELKEAVTQIVYDNECDFKSDNSIRHPDFDPDPQLYNIDFSHLMKRIMGTPRILKTLYRLS